MSTLKSLLPLAAAICACAQANVQSSRVAVNPHCANDAAIVVPAGFCASIFADNLGHARYLAIAANNDVYVSIEGTRPGQQAPLPAFIALRDTDHDGRADRIERVGTKGNTGIALSDGFLYVDQGEAITRFRMTADLVPASPPDTVVSGLPLNPGHRARNFVIAPDGSLYVNVGSPSNACQVKDRALESPGKDPCDELTTRGGIWRFDARRLNQKFDPGARFATGARNSTGMVIGPDGRLYANTHGRDQLTENWPRIFPDSMYGHENPAESLLEVNRGDDFGWPYCFYSFAEQRLVDAPEYGGDGKKTTRCADKKAPLAIFPAHWAPLDLLFYRGSNFPERYRNGVFITFHGSWNRMKGMQAGGKIIFQPMADGRPSGPFEIFADEFAGVPPEEINPAKAKHRPVGLAVAPDGSMFVADDDGGRIYRITYTGRR
jgi:glucose/arabinose dehydrogenase